MITIAELAARYGVTRQRVDQWIAHTPGLHVQRIGRQRVLSDEDIARILARPRQRAGRKPRSRPKSSPFAIRSLKSSASQ